MLFDGPSKIMPIDKFNKLSEAGYKPSTSSIAGAGGLPAWLDPAMKAVGAVADLGGAALNYYGARKANQAQIEQAQKQMDFQKAAAERQMEFGQKSADKSMDFQERMSNTSMQRKLEDMKAAGINPILMYNQGGASTPSGATATGVGVSGAQASIENELSGVTSSAVAMRRATADIERIRADTELTRELARAARYDNSGKKVESSIDEGKYGSIVRHLQRLNPFASSAGSIIRSLK